ncbi:MAG TPA: L-seryl-tRNA(Sec) selenium transferase [Candidatus Cybelea sp.]|nr:L-seryl-tRNA(Sec) selenium transferase [Candidatus Cybelea sp.]
MHRILDDPRLAALAAQVGRERIKRAAQEVLGRVRLFDEGDSGAGALDAIVTAVFAAAAETQRRHLRRVINATGIVLHTNLGRAPLGAAAFAAVDALRDGYSNLEYDLASGERGSRYAALDDLLASVIGAGGLAVNNGAAAVLLVLDTFARGREVVVARGELVEIGGGFRIPDVLERSGATLVEVGTTNRVYIGDYERALSARTALILRTHASNFRLDGFVAAPAAEELCALSRRAGVPLVEDLGTGALVDLAPYGLPHERTAGEAIAGGVDLLTFSGDKLLGGPQAGIVAGRAHLLARLRNNPLLRALRLDKLTLAALAATLECYLDGSWAQRIPVYQMLCAGLEELRERAKTYAAAVARAEIVDTTAYAGGGALPQASIASVGIALAPAHAGNFAARLRACDPPIVARIEADRVVLDLRTIAPFDDERVVACLVDCARA